MIKFFLLAETEITGPKAGPEKLLYAWVCPAKGWSELHADEEINGVAPRCVQSLHSRVMVRSLVLETDGIDSETGGGGGGG